MSDRDIISITSCTTEHVCAYKVEDVHLFEKVVCWGLTRDGEIIPLIFDEGGHSLEVEDYVSPTDNFLGVYSSPAAARALLDKGKS